MRLQSFPRSWAKRCLGLETFCRETLGADLRRAAGAGLLHGADSTALLYAFACAHTRTGLSSSPPTLIMGCVPLLDAELVHAIKVCAELAVPCETTRLDVPAHRTSGRGVEESARFLRYEFLESVRTKYDADWIVTAHHADDLAEDIVFRLIRGTGWPGLGGMTGLDAQRRLLRPVLGWSKEELRAFALACGLTWNEDYTNQNTDLTRNRIRRHILPLLYRENPSFHRSVLSLWKLARLDEDFWQKELAENKSAHFLPHSALAACHPAKRLRLYKAVLDRLGPGQARSGHLFLLDQAWQLRKTGTTIHFRATKQRK